MRRPARSRADLTSAAGTTFTFIAPRGLTHPKTRAHVRLLGPCFKTGRMHPYDRQHPKGMVRDHHPNDRQPSQSTASSPPHWTAGRKDGTLATGGMPCLPLGQTQSQPMLTRAPEKCDGGEKRAPGRGPFRSANPAPTPPTQLNLRGRIAESIRFPSDGFTYFLTLFSKFFSSFPHGTCSLSVSRQYLALDGVYHPFWAAFPNNPTLRKRPAAPQTELSPSATCCSKQLRHRRST